MSGSQGFGLYTRPGGKKEDLIFYCAACARELGAEYVRQPKLLPLAMWRCEHCGSQPRWL